VDGQSSQRKRFAMEQRTRQPTFGETWRKKQRKEVGEREHIV
jgi:hypothetical protein